MLVKFNLKIDIYYKEFFTPILFSDIRVNIDNLLRRNTFIEKNY